jgi:hypothetical protein
LLAEINPELALATATAALSEAIGGDRHDEVHARRAIGVAERMLGRPEQGLHQLDQALDRAGCEERLRGLVLDSRAACKLATGDVQAALADLDEALTLLHGVDRAVAVLQRASILVRLSENASAIRDIDRAISVLSRGGARMYEAHARNNRGLVRTYAGSFGLARADLERARRLYLQLGMTSGAADSLHNLAFLDARCGDIIGALGRFELARTEFRSLGRNLGVLDLDTCDALLAAGLAREALERSTTAIDALQAAGNRFEVPEAELVAALASLQCNDPGEALRWATIAEDDFRSLGRDGWADLAGLVRLRCREPDLESIDAGRELVRRLDASGLVLGALQARLLVTALLLRHGSLDEARTSLSGLSARRLPPDLRLGVYDLAARIADLTGDDRACTDWMNRGSRELDRFQSSFASAEIRWSVTTHARALLEFGRDRALRLDDTARLFRSIELTRANALRRSPLERSDDGAMSSLLDELRSVARALREPGNPVEARQLLSRQLQLQRAVAERERATRPAALHEIDSDVIALGALRRALMGCRLVELDVIQGRLIAVIIDRRRTQRLDLGPSRRIVALFDAAGLALSRLARGNLGETSVRAAISRLEAIGHDLDTVFAECWRGQDEVVIVPPTELHAAAWALLPTLAAIPFTIAASATIWARAARRHLPRQRSVTLIVGSRLQYAAGEARSIAKVYQAATTLTRGRATAKRVVDAIDGTWLAHFATHHQHRRENPLFGTLELADGPLYLHDLLRVRQLPRVVVLSACEAAEGSPGPIGDVLGASTVLMERGTATVIASPSLVPDTGQTGASMLKLHQRLAAGDHPALALLEVRRSAAEVGRREQALAAGYVCFGASR